MPPQFRACPIIKQLSNTFISFQPHINLIAFIRRLRNQNWLFPPSIADLIEEDHICRLVDEIVEGIDLKRIEEKYSGPGSPAYHPKVMMKILIQGTIDGIRSSRKISKATKENVVYMYLSDRLNPDFRTICRFRNDNLETIKLVFAEIIKLAREMGMVKFGHLSIDGTKIKASASNFSVLSKKELDEIKEAIDMELQKGIEIDEMEDEIYGDTDPDKLPEPFKDVKERIRKDKAAKIIEQYKKGDLKEKNRIEKQLEKAQNELKASGKEFVSFTDPESRFMLNKKHLSEFSYNPQVTVDAEHGIVVAEDVVQNVRDVDQLKPQIERTEDVVGELPKDTVVSADNGYYSTENIDFLKEHKLEGYIPHEKLASRMKGKTKELGRFDKDKFKYNAETDEFTCPNGEPVKFSFEYFDKHKGKQVRVYRGVGCAQCPDKKLCTKSKRKPKLIKCYDNEANMREMAEKMNSPEGLSSESKNGGTGVRAR
ncbi:MAG: Transposase DDE domain protein [Candidatus Syntrophoarchaeum sp. GoM_oil]|nr:MAG: Transposase DDE domain protein [Candidatus Syntrophoarchaeum sp. GoM_oil]